MKLFHGGGQQKEDRRRKHLKNCNDNKVARDIQGDITELH